MKKIGRFRIRDWLFTCNEPVIYLRFADHWQDNPALVCGFTGKQFLYKDVTALTKKFGSHLLENGFSPGDKIATIVPNCPEFGPVLLGSLGKIKIMF